MACGKPPTLSCTCAAHNLAHGTPHPGPPRSACSYPGWLAPGGDAADLLRSSLASLGIGSGLAVTAIALGAAARVPSSAKVGAATQAGEQSVKATPCTDGASQHHLLAPQHDCSWWWRWLLCGNTHHQRATAGGGGQAADGAPQHRVHGACESASTAFWMLSPVQFWRGGWYFLDWLLIAHWQVDVASGAAACSLLGFAALAVMGCSQVRGGAVACHMRCSHTAFRGLSLQSMLAPPVSLAHDGHWRLRGAKRMPPVHSLGTPLFWE